MTWKLRVSRVPDGSDRPERQAPSVLIDSQPENSVMPEWNSVADHAHQLILHLKQNGPGRGSILSADLQRVHLRMCFDLNWLPRPWAPIANALRQWSGGKKTYAWVGGRRRRVFSIDRLVSTSEVSRTARPPSTSAQVANES